MAHRASDRPRRRRDRVAGDRHEPADGRTEEQRGPTLRLIGNPVGAETRRYPDHLDARLLTMAGVCVLAAVTTIVDTTVVNVAQRTFVEQFRSTEAIVAWTMTGYLLALAAVIPLSGWAADRFGTKR